MSFFFFLLMRKLLVDKKTNVCELEAERSVRRHSSLVHRLHLVDFRCWLHPKRGVSF